jgi:RecB family exonuclease
VLPLPPILETVKVPAFFPPSSIAAAKTCLLRLVASSGSVNRNVFKLLPGPDAEWGSLVHRALERKHTYEEFLQDVSARSAELRSNSRTRSYSDLVTAIAPAKITAAKNRIEQQPRPTGDVAGRRNVVRRGPEVKLESAELRLRGSADRISVEEDGTVVITDYKTGSAISELGEIKDEYVKQMHAYALMLQEQEGIGPIRLEVDDGEVHIVPSGADILEESRVAIIRATARFQSGAELDAQTLAEPGEACASCDIRITCGAYRSIVKSWWKGPPSGGRLPMDTAGVVQKLESAPNGQTAWLTDLSGRAVQIVGLDARHGLSEESVGNTVWFCNAAHSSVRRGFNGEPLHPRVFRELPRNRGDRRAWRLETFA